ncbi:MFS transporter [Reticulibacter mediterranei]|uniref:Putative proline/betaine transporter n=1 Tax=Reticulibacter mediterranei TaxID=2778369 RepID=A0A8J3N6X6_9CHLR|nr:MFS transporter [Reticulibacter mediterranei]GHO97900.1 MFS transporter [Reticulibacter mediterranei]
MSEVTASPRPTSIVQVATASLIGTSIEWYDFFIFGTGAALVFPKLFFPTLSPISGQLASFLVFWVGFLGRPLGGIIFGHYGDRIGRKRMLVLTILLMGLGTFLIGALPSYATIGVLAPILLIVLRLCQGIAVGGEWGGAVLMATEHAPAHRRGFFGSWPQIGVPVGVILSSLIFNAVIAWFPGEGLLNIGWRIPFLASIILVAVGLFIRMRITETPDFEQLKENQEIDPVPVISVIRHNWKTVLLAAGSFFVSNGSFYIFITFLVSYATGILHVPASYVLNATLIGSVISLAVLPLAGAWTDRVGRLPVYLGGAVMMALVAFPLFWLVDMKSPLTIILGACLGQVALSLMYGPQAAFFSELFGANVRYSGASLGYQAASVLAGGLAPTIATTLLLWSGNASWTIALYIIVMSAITFVSVYLAGETRPAAAPAASESAGD